MSTETSSPAGNHLGVWEVLVPVAGATIIGFTARYGSERIRGHGIPEAIESIFLRGGRVEPRLALLKPLSSAISIGTTLTWRIKEAGSAVLVSLEHSGWKDAAPDAVAQGWKHFLGSLKSYVRQVPASRGDGAENGPFSGRGW